MWGRVGVVVCIYVYVYASLLAVVTRFGAHHRAEHWRLLGKVVVVPAHVAGVGRIIGICHVYHGAISGVRRSQTSNSEKLGSPAPKTLGAGSSYDAAAAQGGGVRR